MFNGECGVCRRIAGWVRRAAQSSSGETSLIERPIGDDPDALRALNPELDIWDAYATIHLLMPDGSMKLGGEAVAEVLRTLDKTKWFAGCFAVSLFGFRPFQLVLNVAYAILADVRPLFGCESCGTPSLWVRPIRWCLKKVKALFDKSHDHDLVPHFTPRSPKSLDAGLADRSCLQWLMTRKMYAAVVEQFGKPLTIQEWEIPSPGAGQILVKTEACGVCHTDLHAANGDWPLKPTLPFIPGHEGIGRVVAAGAGVTAVKEGDRVGVPWLYSACGHCEHCLAAWETVCPQAQFGGYTKNGGFAEYLLADPNYVAHVPAGLSAKEAAPIICAGVTTYKGIKETGARPGQWIAISGVGGLGHLAIQYAKVMGLQVCAVDVDDGKLAHAKRLGADLVINAKAGDPAAAVKKATGGGAHGVLITAPSLGAFKQGVGMTRSRGTCVLVGLPPGEFPVPLFEVVASCITIRGSFVGTRQDMVEALAFAADGKVKADIELQPLSSINNIFERLQHGHVESRVVIDFDMR